MKPCIILLLLLCLALSTRADCVDEKNERYKDALVVFTPLLTAGTVLSTLLVPFPTLGIRNVFYYYLPLVIFIFLLFDV